MISVLKNQLAFSKQITPCLDLSGGSTTQNQHGLSFLLNLSLMIGLALILYPLFVFSHQSFSDENAHVCVFFQRRGSGCAATFTWRSQFNLPATEFTEHCSNRWIWVSPETQTLVSLLMHVISDINSSWKERLVWLFSLGLLNKHQQKYHQTFQFCSI